MASHSSSSSHAFDSIPSVMCFSGNDPSGCDGLPANIETLTHLGCHCAPIVTALSIKDTVSTKDIISQASSLVLAQARTVLEDMPIHAFLIGLLGSIQNAEAIYRLISDYPNIPVILDAFKIKSDSGAYINEEIIEKTIHFLSPHLTLMVISSPLLKMLAPGSDTIDACAHYFMSHGCQNILVRRSQKTADTLENTLYGKRQLLEKFSFPVFKENFIGASTTLTTSIAGYMAHGLEPLSAVREAQKYTLLTLQNAHRIGMGKLKPNRLYTKHSLKT